MEQQAVGAVLMHGHMGATQEQRLVERARLAVLSGHITSLRNAGVDVVAVATDSVSLVRQQLEQRPDRWIPTPHVGFDFGETLKQAISSLSLSACIYMGSGAGVFLRPGDYDALVAWARHSPVGVLLNNLYSTDFASIAQARHLLKLQLPQSDNALGMALTDQGVPCRSLPRNLRTQYDIDTPIDVLLLGATTWRSETFRAACEQNVDMSSIDAVLDTLTDRSGRLWLYGRVNPATWAWFQDKTACQTAGVIEGRGLRSYKGSSAGGAVPCVSGSLFSKGGWDSFFDSLAGHASAAILDTRPLLPIGSGAASTADRFRSDLLQAERIDNRGWKAFTLAAREASLPLLLGGHNLMSGGLYLLGRACWKRRNVERRLCGKTMLEKKE
ncbi:hypothetical protein JW848_09665 [Candidatus Bipolaricaulota bacterium]|nr:hypothetical protein [Candidatus Bipolaricaulota bacterium]